MINKVFTKIEFYFNKKGVIILSFLVLLYILCHFADRYYGILQKTKHLQIFVQMELKEKLILLIKNHKLSLLFAIFVIQKRKKLIILSN
jgi:hypothetical protein